MITSNQNLLTIPINSIHAQKSYLLDVNTYARYFSDSEILVPDSELWMSISCYLYHRDKTRWEYAEIPMPWEIDWDKFIETCNIPPITRSHFRLYKNSSKQSESNPNMDEIVQIHLDIHYSVTYGKNLTATKKKLLEEGLKSFARDNLQSLIDEKTNKKVLA